jgi:hypothetical protein
MNNGRGNGTVVCGHLADPPVDDVRAGLVAGGRALGSGDLRAGRRHFDAAYRAAERAGDAEGMAEAALGMGGLWVHEHRNFADATLLTHRLGEALTRVDPGSPAGLRLRVRLAAEACYRTGAPGPVLALLDEARSAGDPVTRADAASIAHHCLLGPGHGELRRTLAAELVEESFRTGRRSDLLMGLLWQTVDMFLDADAHAGRRLGELRKLLAGRSHLAVEYVVAGIDVMLAIRAGELDRAESLARACAERGTDAGDVDVTGWYGAQIVAIRWYQGRLVETLPMLTELVDSPTLSTLDYSALAALAVAAATAGDHPRAASALATLRGDDLADLPRSSSWLGMMSGVAEAAYLLADAPPAARVYELMQPYAHLPIIGSLGIVCLGSAHHTLGVASLTMGDLDRAVEHFQAAVDRNLALAHWPAVIASRQRLAQALTARGQRSDAALAAREAASATRLATEFGLPHSDESPHPDEGLPPPDESLPHPDESGAGEDPEPLGATATCTRSGRSWRVTLGLREVLVEHRIGMLYLAVLVANPGQEIDVVDLAAGPSALVESPRAAGETTTSRRASDQPLLDPVAIREYRDRQIRLRQEIADLEAGDEFGRADQARAELDWITTELAAAAGLGGRTRAFPTDRERARIAVGKAIRRALDHVTKADPVIGEHFARTIRTGTRCAYWPV